ncbi:Dps family protein [Xanthomonas fragariae]|uniref:DNA protection during starvation protein 2 n=1 Tax=Xanthomonas fragariae TaxID=48664 RepID=A0A1Y6HB39_9XANT|nr:Dps family protein [Xanthomonas fragariae]AOD14050.1 DNA starvation/stationary phase protection protein [Xanthomonas fragariae]AOD17435.1 DNA starvation/stationary phase protection protein [Xanthomonas fragariae]ENZ94451.1 DNA-binding related protein [Xanthomonas fragariae LMG 25863]MBL9197791.1 DNA starvation/stationary phase protection protein [Xanthomonas fragariae]MBL9219897.1 DNA starvation/stationary phase protection protein [Xanthomonas fragariae]
MSKKKNANKPVVINEALDALPVAAASAPHIDIGIKDSDRKQISDGLARYMADAFTLYLKTHNFHWNVTGSMFNSLHTMFETQYTEQWAALDEVAERIRALGYNAPGSYREFVALTSITEEPGQSDSADWREMVRQLVSGNEAVCRTARKVLGTADDAGDDPTVDLLTQRLQTHEKYAWMLRSLLQ